MAIVLKTSLTWTIETKASPEGKIPKDVETWVGWSDGKFIFDYFYFFRVMFLNYKLKERESVWPLMIQGKLLLFCSRWINHMILAKRGKIGDTRDPLGSQRGVISPTDLWPDFWQTVLTYSFWLSLHFFQPPPHVLPIWKWNVSGATLIFLIVLWVSGRKVLTWPMSWGTLGPVGLNVRT